MHRSHTLVLALLAATLGPSVRAQVPIPEGDAAGPAPPDVQQILYREALEDGQTWKQITIAATGAALQGGEPSSRTIEGMTVATDALSRQHYALSFSVGTDSLVTLYRHGAGEPGRITMLPSQFLLLAEKTVPVLRGEHPSDDLFQIGAGPEGVTFAWRTTYSRFWIASILLFVIGGPAFAVYAGGVWRERKRKANETRRLREAIEWRECERKRMARELHDGPLQDVLLVKRMILSAESVSANPANVELARTAITGAAQGIRAIGDNLDPPALQYGLKAGLRTLVDKLSKHYPAVEIDFHYEAAENSPDVVGDRRLHAYRIVQEALNNALKHARSQHVRVSLSLGSRGIHASVKDDGEGLPQLSKIADAHERGSGGYGLKSARDRAGSIGGTLDWQSDSEGTTVSLFIPFDLQA